jgi:hypothetical protein
MWMHFSNPHLTGCPKGDSSNSAKHLDLCIHNKTNNQPLGNPTAKATTLTAMAKPASFASCKITSRGNARRDSKPTNHVWIQMDARSGPRSTWQTPEIRHRFRPWTSLSQIFSSELDGNPTSSSAQAPLIIPQIIMSLSAISIVTCNKLSEIMTPFYGGNKTWPRINMTTGDKTFNWLFNIGAAIMCMNANNFQQAFHSYQPKLIQKGTGIVLSTYDH